MGSPFGPHGELVEAQLARLEACRWLRPDGELEALAPAALDWLRERADEHLAALGVWLTGQARPPPAAVAVERSIAAACDRWAAAWKAPPRKSIGLVRALDAAREHACEAAAVALKGPRNTRLRERLRDAVARASEAPSPWASVRSVAIERARASWRAEPGPVEPLPAEVVADLHVSWLLAHGDAPEWPSPWGPLLAVWERGAWPLPLPDGTLLTYVPVLRDGALVPEPDRPTEVALPTRPPRPAPVGRSLPPLDLLGIAPPPAMPMAAPPAVLPAGDGWGARGGRIAVVSPLPPRRRDD